MFSFSGGNLTLHSLHLPFSRFSFSQFFRYPRIYDSFCIAYNIFLRFRATTLSFRNNLRSFRSCECKFLRPAVLYLLFLIRYIPIFHIFFSSKGHCIIYPSRTFCVVAVFVDATSTVVQLLWFNFCLLQCHNIENKIAKAPGKLARNEERVSPSTVPFQYNFSKLILANILDRHAAWFLFSSTLNRQPHSINPGR